MHLLVHNLFTLALVTYISIQCFNDIDTSVIETESCLSSDILARRYVNRMYTSVISALCYSNDWWPAVDVNVEVFNSNKSMFGIRYNPIRRCGHGMDLIVK